MRGVLNFIVTEGRKMRVGKNACIVPFKETAISSKANVTFSLFQLDPGSTVEFDPNTGANMIVGALNVKFASQLLADSFNISSSELLVELAAKISCSASDRPGSDLDVDVGSAPVKENVYGGAGHGGLGGEDLKDETSGGYAYGSVYLLTSPGTHSTPD